MTADQLNTEIQLVRTSGWVATCLSNPAKCEAQAERADLGMCLIAYIHTYIQKFITCTMSNKND